MGETYEQSNDMTKKVATNTIKPFLQANDKSIFFDENWDVGIGGGLWSNGLSLSKYFLDHSDLLRRNLQGVISRKKKRVGRDERIRAIELGSGNGLLGCCLAAAVGDLIDTLYITDLEDHLELMRQTILANSHIVTLKASDDNPPNGENSEHVENDDNKTATINDHNANGSSVDCHVMECDWGKHSSGPLAKKFDFIFGSDIAYRDYLHQPLISTLLQLSDDHTISIIGVTMTDTKPIFFTSLWEAGFRYERIPDHLLSQEFRGTTFGLFVIQKR